MGKREWGVRSTKSPFGRLETASDRYGQHGFRLGIIGFCTKFIVPLYGSVSVAFHGRQISLLLHITPLLGVLSLCLYKLSIPLRRISSTLWNLDGSWETWSNSPNQVKTFETSVEFGEHASIR